MLGSLAKVYRSLGEVKATSQADDDRNTFAAAEKAIADTRTYDGLTKKDLDLLADNETLTRNFSERGVTVTRLAQEYAANIQGRLRGAIDSNDSAATTRFFKTSSPSPRSSGWR